METKLERITQLSKENPEMVFTSIGHLINTDMLRDCHREMDGKKAVGIDGVTKDDYEENLEENLTDLMDRMKRKAYHPKPARRVEIPKDNGKTRPLSIYCYEDKLVQEALRRVLEAVFEPQFYDEMMGFRPNRGCHEALRLLNYQLVREKTSWLIDADIKGFFDNIDHNVLIEILRERILDERFLRLIRKFLNAGYLEEWQFNKTYSGTPQGGIVSPILANIYLDKFDKFMEEYAQKFRKGTVRRRNKDICKLNNRVHYLKKRISEVKDADKISAMIDELRTKQRQILTMPSGADMDENFRRLKYVRIGTKEECVKIKADITNFMQEKLKLEMSQEKTLITNAQDYAKFLGYEICVRKDYTAQKNARGEIRRHRNGNVVLHISREVIKKKLIDLAAMEVVSEKGKEVWRYRGRTYLMDLEPQEIVSRYNTEIRGFYKYYSIANNASALGSSFGSIMKFSMFKTLAMKWNCSVRAVTNKLRKDDNFVVWFTDKKGERKPRVFYNEGEIAYGKHTISEDQRLFNQMNNNDSVVIIMGNINLLQFEDYLKNTTIYPVYSHKNKEWNPVLKKLDDDNKVKTVNITTEVLEKNQNKTIYEIIQYKRGTPDYGENYTVTKNGTIAGYSRNVFIIERATP